MLRHLRTLKHIFYADMDVYYFFMQKLMNGYR